MSDLVLVQVLAGILHLGNAEFEGSDPCEVTSASEPSLQRAAVLLGMAPEKLKGAECTQRTMLGHTAIGAELVIFFCREPYQDQDSQHVCFQNAGRGKGCKRLCCQGSIHQSV